MHFSILQTNKTLQKPSKMLDAPEASHPGHQQVGLGGRAAPPGRVKAKACLDPAPGRAHARGARATARRRRRWWRGRAEEGWRGPGKACTARRRRRRTSPARARAKSGSGLAARRTGAAAGEGERRWPCRGGEGAGLVPESEEEEKLSPRGIETANQRRRGSSGGGRRQWGAELGFAGRRKDEAAASSWRIRASGGVKRWHGSRRWPARGSAGRRRRRVRRAASETERGEGRGD